ncbi:hypothetical protein [Gallibacterium anatis]|uniref:hypothetical protein n=1 Tax=Gallibacterium anatis TaxID=750 RepID=UPI000B9FBC69|nr:hypothetical protein [Gallibacterium anatis]WAX71614.1 hypothetical protein CF557_00745 [Gallibacterium anatis]
MDKAKIIEFAKSQGYASLEFEGVWNGYQQFLCLSEEDLFQISLRPLMGGYRRRILVKDNEIRLMTHKEIKEAGIWLSPDEIENPRGESNE